VSNYKCGNNVDAWLSTRSAVGDPLAHDGGVGARLAPEGLEIGVSALLLVGQITEGHPRLAPVVLPHTEALRLFHKLVVPVSTLIHPDGGEIVVAVVTSHAIAHRLFGLTPRPKPLEAQAVAPELSLLNDGDGTVY